MGKEVAISGGRFIVMGRVFRAAATEQGSELVEFALVLMPLLCFVFALFSISWILFAQASLQYAVREGCRYAVTSPGSSQPSIQSVVQQNSFGFIQPQDLENNVVTVTQTSSTGINTITVRVNQFAVPIIGGALFNAYSIGLSASSSDAMENPPPGS